MHKDQHIYNFSDTVKKQGSFTHVTFSIKLKELEIFSWINCCKILVPKHVLFFYSKLMIKGLEDR